MTIREKAGAKGGKVLSIDINVQQALSEHQNGYV
jgi:hypothetical protein